MVRTKVKLTSQGEDDTKWAFPRSPRASLLIVRLVVGSFRFSAGTVLATRARAEEKSDAVAGPIKNGV